MRYGAFGVVIRTLAPDSATSGAHTGTQEPYRWDSGSSGGSSSSGTAALGIPAMCMAVEDVELIARLGARGHGVRLSVTLPCRTLPDTVSRNLVFEIIGVYMHTYTYAQCMYVYMPGYKYFSHVSHRVNVKKLYILRYKLFHAAKLWKLVIPKGTLCAV